MSAGSGLKHIEGRQNDPEDDDDLGDFSLEGVELYSSPTEFTTAKMAEKQSGKEEVEPG